MVFKTIPFGRSGIPPGARLGRARLDTVEPAQRDQHFGYRERPVGPWMNEWMNVWMNQLLNADGLDTRYRLSLVRGSHGLLPPSADAGPLLISDDKRSAVESLPQTGVKAFLLRRLFGE